jgi:hypothetical protein
MAEFRRNRQTITYQLNDFGVTNQSASFGPLRQLTNDTPIGNADGFRTIIKYNDHPQNCKFLKSDR